MFCDGSHTHGQSRGTALKLAENYTFTLTDFIHSCFRSRANQAQTAKNRKRLALPAMSRRSDDSNMTITEKMNVRALKTAGLKTVPQQSNMSEWLACRKCLDVQGIGTQGGRTSFQRSSLRQRSWHKETGRKTSSWLQD